MISIHLDVTLTLVGPILTKSTTAGLAGIGAAMAKSDDSYFLPFSLVRGRFRQSLEELGCESVTDLLGPDPKSAGDTVDPRRGRLLFSDFRHRASRGRRLSHRVSIDPERGAAASRELLVIDSPFAPGEPVEFSGTISYWAASDAAANDIERQVMLGLRFITSFGSGRTVGFGRLKEVILQRRERPIGSAGLSASVQFTHTDCLSLTLSEFTGPLCVVKRPSGKNLFVSDEAIPGSAIKGALAELLSKLPPSNYDALRHNLDRVRFTHAFPGKDKRPMIPPLSLVKVKKAAPNAQLGAREDTVLLDVALCSGPITVNGCAPEFSVDWKDRSDVQRKFGWPVVKRELRVRTAINRERQRADEGMLFAYEMINPDNLLWHGHADLGLVEPAQKQQVASDLAAVLQEGLPGIGKTKAHAQHVTLKPLTERPRARSQDGCWLLCVQTPALLVDPLQFQSCLDIDDLREQYQQIFDQLAASGGLSRGALHVERIFATQAIYGGYLVHRFQRPDLPDRPYHPFLLTEPGSVFVLRHTNTLDTKKIELLIQSWQDHGLPLPNWATARYGNTWRTCPFLPQNGFGEVVTYTIPKDRDATKSNRDVGEVSYDV